MGCAASNIGGLNANSLNNKPFKKIPDKTNFTQDQIELIKSSWKQIEDKNEFGTQVSLK
jgi:hypothetical protein